MAIAKFASAQGGMLMRGERLDHLQGRIYDAAIDSALWPAVLTELAEVVGGNHAVLLEGDVITGAGRAIGSSGLDRDTFDAYFDYYAAINPLLLVDDFAQYSQGWRPMMRRDEDWLPRAVLTKSEYWSDFIRPLDASRGLIWRLDLEGTSLQTLNISRRDRDEHFSDGEIAELAPLHGHAVRAVRIARRFAAVEAFAAGATASLDAVAEPLMMLAADGRLVHANIAADRLLRDGRLIGATRGRLAAANPSASAALHRAIAEAGGPGTRTGAIVPLRATDGSEMEASVLPVGVESGLAAVAGPAVLVRLAPPSATQRLDARMARYGLTRAEAALTRLLLDGCDLRSAAAARGLSIHTVRRQLADVFDKTNVHRQAELVSLLTRDS